MTKPVKRERGAPVEQRTVMTGEQLPARYISSYARALGIGEIKAVPKKELGLGGQS